MQSIEFQAMGTRILVAIDRTDTDLEALEKKVTGWFFEWEQTLSRFRVLSELSQINIRAGKLTPVSQTMWEVVSVAKQMELWSDGLVSPLVLNALEFAGYEMNFDEMPREIYRDLSQFSDENPVQTTIELDETHRAILIPHNHRMDLGGIAKGWAAHQTMVRLQGIAPVLVDAGGDIAVSGPRQDGSPWLIGIAKANFGEEDTSLVELKEGAIATSGIDHRRWKRNGLWQHHIIDPRTGEPAQTDILSATVMAEDVMVAEAAAKSALILGSTVAPTWLESRGLTQYLFQLEKKSSPEDFIQYDNRKIESR
jgi:FAD:protein FMN transferase